MRRVAMVWLTEGARGTRALGSQAIRAVALYRPFEGARPDGRVSVLASFRAFQRRDVRYARPTRRDALPGDRRGTAGPLFGLRRAGLCGFAGLERLSGTVRGAG